MPVPGLLSYAQLVAAVPDYAGRGDPRFLAAVPTFIALGEARIFQTGDVLLRCREMLVSVALVVPAGSARVSLPADFLAFSRVSTTAQPRVEYMPLDQLSDIPAPGDATRYSIDGLTFVYGYPQAAGAGNLQVAARYYQDPGNLNGLPSGSTWLLQKAPLVYLYAALCEAALWAKNPTKAGEWGSLLERAITTLNNADKAEQLAGGRLRVQGRIS